MIIDRTHTFHGYNRWITSGGSFTPAVLEHLVHSMEMDAGHAKKSGKGRLRPSLIGDRCDRKQVLSYLYADGSKFHGNWMAWSGTFLHLAFQTYLLDAYEGNVRIEHPVRPRNGRAGVTGKADWYWFKQGISAGLSTVYGPHLGDYKTIKSLRAVESQPKPEHVEQLLSEMYTMELRVAYLVYQVRDYGQMLTYQLQAEDADLERIGTRLETLKAHIDKGGLPEVLLPCRSHSGPFKECDWTEICMAEAAKGR